MRTVHVPVPIATALQRGIAAAAPREFVGALGGHWHDDVAHVRTLVPLPNSAATTDRFAVEPLAFAVVEHTLRRDGGWLGFVHGHPHGDATLSAKDRRELWSHCLQLVAAPGRGADFVLRAYERTVDGCRELPVRCDGEGLA